MYLAPPCARWSVIVCLLLAFVASSPGTSLVRAPYLQNIGADRATILWTASEQVDASVRYSEDGNLARAVAASVQLLPFAPGAPPVFQYRVDLRNLEPNRDYIYQVVVDQQVVYDDLRFRTAGPGPFRFLVFGDSGTGGEAQMAIARRMVENESPSLVLHTGDLSQESGTPQQLDATYLSVYAQLMGRAPFFPTPGNHDYYTDAGKPCFAIHAPPVSAVPPEDYGRYYSFDWGNVHFISLNSNLIQWADGAVRMLDWLERDLASQKNFWKVVYFHHTPYPTGHHVNDPVSAIMRNRVVPILERYGVQLVLAGHEHSYQRTLPLRAGSPVESGGTVYITTGGGGGVLHPINPGPLHAIGRSVHHYVRVDVRGARMILNVIDGDGQFIDNFVLNAQTDPVIESVVNAASFRPSLGSGSLISIFGRDLAVVERAASAPATELAGTSVTLNGEALPLLYVAPHQINAQLPYGVTGTAVLRVNSRSSIEEVPVQIGPSAPAILQVQEGFRSYPAIWKSSTNGLATRAAPIVAGETVTIFLVGLGEVNGTIQAGEIAPASPAVAMRKPVFVDVGGRRLQPSFAGLVPGFMGLYQVNVEFPPGLPAGPAGLRVVTADGRSNPATVFVAGGASLAGPN